MEFDNFEALKAKEAFSMFDEAIMLAGEVSLMSHLDIDSIYEVVGKRLRDINNRTDEFNDFEFVYSGLGYCPSADHEGDPITAYKKVNYARGQLNEIYLADSSGMNYVSPDQIVLPGDDEEDEVDEYDLMELRKDANFTELESFREGLSVAPDGIRMFAEFVVQKGLAENDQIYGVSIRGDLDSYNIVDLTTLEIIDVKEQSNLPVFEPHSLNLALDVISQNYRRLLKDKTFRNLSVEKQRETLDSVIEQANEHCQVQRFSALSNASHLFVPDTDNENFRFEHCMTGLSFIGECLRIDCIESQRVSQGDAVRKRRGNTNSSVSLCLVLELDDLTQKTLELDTNIVWLPLFEQTEDIIFLEKSIGY